MIHFQGYVTENGFYVLDTTTGAVKLVHTSTTQFVSMGNTISTYTTGGTSQNLYSLHNHKLNHHQFGAII